MIEKFCSWVESITIKKVLNCILVLIIAAFSVGFAIGKGTEYSLIESQNLGAIQNEKN